MPTLGSTYIYIYISANDNTNHANKYRLQHSTNYFIIMCEYFLCWVYQLLPTCLTKQTWVKKGLNIVVLGKWLSTTFAL